MSGRGRAGLQLLQPSTLLEVLSSDELEVQSERQVLEVLWLSLSCVLRAPAGASNGLRRSMQVLQVLHDLVWLCNPHTVPCRQLQHGASMTLSKGRHSFQSCWLLSACRPRSCSNRCVRLLTPLSHVFAAAAHVNVLSSRSHSCLASLHMGLHATPYELDRECFPLVLFGDGRTAFTVCMQISYGMPQGLASCLPSAGASSPWPLGLLLGGQRPSPAAAQEHANGAPSRRRA